MVMAIKPIGNTTNLSTATNLNNATCVYVVNTGSTVRTVTIANTVSHVNGGGLFGTDTVPASQASVTLGKAGEAGATLIIRKKPTDTINGGHAEVKGTKIADNLGG